MWHAREGAPAELNSRDVWSGHEKQLTTVVESDCAKHGAGGTEQDQAVEQRKTKSLPISGPELRSWRITTVGLTSCLMLSITDSPPRTDSWPLCKLLARTTVTADGDVGFQYSNNLLTPHRDK